MIFLDTNIISYYFNANTKIKEKILDAIDNGEDICMTVINIYEILKGFKWKNNGILISNNIKHYEGIEGLKLENWL